MPTSSVFAILAAMSRPIRIVLAIAALLGPHSAAQAGPDETAMIRKILSDRDLARADFTDRFLNAVPLSRVIALRDTLSREIGPVLAVSESIEGYDVTTETHSIGIKIHLDGAGRVAGLFFAPPIATGISVDAALDQIRALHGDVSFLIRQNGTARAQQAADRPMAVGSAFKLAVLDALNADIARGARHWQDVHHLQPGDKSLPSGQLQDFPDGSPLTLHSLAALMIAKSDNTATDMLLRVLGPRAPVALRTRSFFILKSDPARRAAYLALPENDRAAYLGQMDTETLPNLAHGDTGILAPHMPGIEWYYSTTALCDLIQGVADLDLMAINPGPTRPEDWARVAFKGGSETGVMNLTTEVTDHAGARSCISLTVNDTEMLNAAQITSAYAALLAALARD